MGSSNIKNRLGIAVHIPGVEISACPLARSKLKTERASQECWGTCPMGKCFFKSRIYKKNIGQVQIDRGQLQYLQYET